MNKNQGNWKELIKAIFALLVMFGTLYGAINYIDGRIEKKVNDIEYIRKVAAQVRPAIIFDSNGSIVNDLGGMEYIEKIKIIPHEGDTPIPKKVILTPRSYLATPPILTSIDSAQYLVKPKRGNNLDWEYEFEIRGSNTGTDYLRFRLEIIK